MRPDHDPLFLPCLSLFPFFCTHFFIFLALAQLSLPCPCHVIVSPMRAPFSIHTQPSSRPIQFPGLTQWKFTQPCSRSSRPRPGPGCRPRLPRPPSCPRLPPSSAGSGSSRPACAATPGCPGPAGSGCPGRARSAPSPRRGRR